MNTRLAIAIAITMTCTVARGDEARARDAAQFLRRLQAAVAARDARTVGTLIRYPLGVVSRQGDDIVIRTPAELGQHYDDVFTPTVVSSIRGQRPADLSSSWRGFMIGNGEVWFDESDDGWRILAVNNAEAALMDRRFSRIRARLAPSLRTLERDGPVCHTDRLTVRIDQLDEGTWRLAAWKTPHADQSHEPDVVSRSAEVEPGGSCGNFRWTFHVEEGEMWVLDERNCGTIEDRFRSYLTVSAPDRPAVEAPCLDHPVR